MSEKNIESPDYRYGKWAGNPKGYKQDSAQCVKDVMHGYMSSQCKKKRAVGLYCKQHAPRENSSN